MALQRSEWERIKALRVVPRMVHKSCDVAMLPHPKSPDGPRYIPWVEKPGHTLNTGRNVDKRALRTGPRKTWRTLPRAS
jgi:hypothetical protein